MQPIALITGITGQDGSYLAELLLEKGYQVHGHSRRRPGDLGASQHLADRLVIHRFAFNEQSRWDRLLADLQPDELYNFAADSFIPNSWSAPIASNEMNMVLPLYLLEAIKKHSAKTRFLNACSREIYGACEQTFANEQTVMNPTTLYGVSKAASRWTVQAYAKHHGIFAVNAILFNHESPRRGPSFVTRKITLAAAMIAHGTASCLELGNTKVLRDWGYAADFVDGMWRMLQLAAPEDFVLGTGQLHSIDDFAHMAFGAAGLTTRHYIHRIPGLLRQVEPSPVAADTTKAQALLDWRPSIELPQLVTLMVNHDLAACRRQLGGLRVA